MGTIWPILNGIDLKTISNESFEYYTTLDIMILKSDGDSGACCSHA